MLAAGEERKKRLIAKVWEGIKTEGEHRAKVGGPRTKPQ
jgi:hypothetical protein